MRREEEEGDGGELAGPRQRALPPLPACCQDAAPLPGLRRGQALAGAATADGGGGGGGGGGSGGRQRQAALETAAEEEEAELAMLLIHMSTGSPLVWEGASGLARSLREKGLLTGRPVGSLPRSNGRLGLPLQLLPEEAFLLTQRGLALMVGAAGEGEGGREGQGHLARARSKAECEEGEWCNVLTEGVSEGERGMDPPEARREELEEGERLRGLPERKNEGEGEGERRRNSTERRSEGEEEGRSGDPTQARREGEKGHRGLTAGGSEGERCRDIVERMGEEEQEGRSGDPTDARTEGGVALDSSYGLQRYLALEQRRRELSVHQLRIQSGQQIKRRREAQGAPEDAEPGQRERTGVGTDSPTPLGEPKGFTFPPDHCLVQIHTSSPLPRLLPALDWQLDNPLPCSPLPRTPPALNWCPDCPQSPRTAVAKDLRQRGYHITAGGKFGGDFLVYPGEAARFHAHFIAMCVRGEKALPLRELLTAGRLACNVNKSVLLCSSGREWRGGAGEEGASLIYTSLGWSGIQ